MAQAFTDWEGTCLMHHGIKGQKWGVRRFQNPDGTLTDKGKARVAKKAGEYLPTHQKKLQNTRGKNRIALAQKYGEDDHDYNYEQQKSRYDRLKDKWAGATLKDLGLKDTKEGRKHVRSILKDIDPNYDFNRRNPYSDADIYSETERAEFRKRHKRMMHPTREKIKRGIKNVKTGADVVSSIKKALPGG